MATTMDRAKIVDKTGADYLAEVYAERVWKAQDEARGLPPARIRTDARYVFRSRPGTLRSFAVVVGQLPEPSADERIDRAHLKAWNNRYTQEAQDALEDITRKVGPRIVFTSVPFKCECYYATDDEDVAAFLLACKESGIDAEMWQHIDFVATGATFQVDGLVFPESEEGYIAAGKYKRDQAAAALPASPAVIAGPRGKAAAFAKPQAKPRVVVTPPTQPVGATP